MSQLAAVLTAVVELDQLAKAIVFEAENTKIAKVDELLERMEASVSDARRVVSDYLGKVTPQSVKPQEEVKPTKKEVGHGKK